MRFLTIMMISYCLMSCSSKSAVDLEEINCRKAIRMIREATDPEFGKLIKAQPITLIPERTSGCAMIFTRVQEESTGEVLGESTQENSQEFAVVLPDIDQRMELQELNSLMKKGPIKIDMDVREIWGDEIPELVVTEKALKASDQYQGLRIFSFVPGVPYAKEILSTPLYIKNSEGIASLAQWSIEKFEEQTIVLLKASRMEQVFSWNDATQSFKLDLAATERKKLSSPSSIKKK
jgi:hypothetical protein